MTSLRLHRALVSLRDRARARRRVLNGAHGPRCRGGEGAPALRADEEGTPEAQLAEHAEGVGHGAVFDDEAVLLCRLQRRTQPALSGSYAQ